VAFPNLSNHLVSTGKELTIQVGNEMKVFNQADALVDVGGSDEFKAGVLKMSLVLGNQGYTGKAYPATMPFHFYAQMLARSGMVQAPVVAALKQTTPGVLTTLRDSDDDYSCMMPHGNGGNPPGNPGNGAGHFPSVCGADGECLPSVCGDCCFHLACYGYEYCCNHCSDSERQAMGMDEECGLDGFSLFGASCDDKFSHYNTCKNTCSGEPIVPTKSPWTKATSSPTAAPYVPAPPAPMTPAPTAAPPAPMTPAPTAAPPAPTATPTAAPTSAPTAAPTAAAPAPTAAPTAAGGCVEDPMGLASCGEVGHGCETAVAYGAQTFDDLGLNGNRWGWASTVSDADTTYTQPVYAAAGGNDISKGYYVGMYTYTFDSASGCLVGSVEAVNGWTYDESHFWMSDEQVTSSSFGQWTNVNDNLNAVSSASYTQCYLGPVPVYTALHLVSCK